MSTTLDRMAEERWHWWNPGTDVPPDFVAGFKDGVMVGMSQDMKVLMDAITEEGSKYHPRQATYKPEVRDES